MVARHRMLAGFIFTLYSNINCYSARSDIFVLYNMHNIFNNLLGFTSYFAHLGEV